MRQHLGEAAKPVPGPLCQGRTKLVLDTQALDYSAGRPAVIFGGSRHRHMLTKDVGLAKASFDPAAAEHLVTVVADRSLAGRNCRDGLVETDLHSTFAHGLDGRRCRRSVVADLHLAGDWRVDGRRYQPVCLAGDQAVSQQTLFWAHGYGVRLGVLVDDVDRCADRNAHAASLADREVLMSLVLSDLVSLLIKDIAWPKRFRRAAAHQRCIIIVADKANLLAFGLVGDGQVQLPGDLTDLLLAILTNG